MVEMQRQLVVKEKARGIPRRERAEKDVTIKIGVEVRRIVIEMKRIVTTTAIEDGITREVLAGVATESAGPSAEWVAVVNMIVGEKQMAQRTIIDRKEDMMTIERKAQAIIGIVAPVELRRTSLQVHH